jgi:peptide/nickel transport system permease protein
VSEAVTSKGPQTQIIEPRRERRLLDFWRRFRRNKLAVFGLFIVAVMILTAIFAPVIAPSAAWTT